MFYRHKQSLMYYPKAIGASFTVAEVPFVMLASMIFCVCFYFLVGFAAEAGKFFWYYLFMTLNLGLFTSAGQVGKGPDVPLYLEIFVLPSILLPHITPLCSSKDVHGTSARQCNSSGFRWVIGGLDKYVQWTSD
jgi:hypothetical protein